jgi:hypothetical protein
MILRFLSPLLSNGKVIYLPVLVCLPEDFIPGFFITSYLLYIYILTPKLKFLYQLPHLESPDVYTLPVDHLLIWYAHV